MTVASLIPVGSVTVRLVSQGDRIAASLKTRGPFEPDSLLRWSEFCRSGGTVIDVGAYTGLYAIGARLLGAKCIAFEPMPANRARFKENAIFNEVSDRVNSEAVSDECGTAALSFAPIAFTSGASLVGAQSSRPAAMKVRTVTIDSLNLPRVAAIKIDVERAEAKVLAGARETIARCRPALLVECLDPELEAAATAAIGAGYRLAETLDVRNRLFLPA